LYNNDSTVTMQKHSGAESIVEQHNILQAESLPLSCEKIISFHMHLLKHGKI